MGDRPESPLVWISATQAINPANVALVFHGRGGEVQITFVDKQMHLLNECDLTAEGRALLLPRVEPFELAPRDALARSP